MQYLGRSGAQRHLLTMVVVALSGVAVAQSSPKPQSQTAPPKPQVVHVLGLEGIKPNAKGNLTVSPAGLDFKGAASHALVRTASIEDIFTADDSRQTGGTAATVAKIAVPYGGGRVISMFTKEKFDSLTVEYRDENGGLHGALLTMPLGQASAIKKQLVTQGAKTSMPVDETAAAKDAAPKVKQ